MGDSKRLIDGRFINIKTMLENRENALLGKHFQVFLSFLKIRGIELLPVGFLGFCNKVD